MEVEHAQAALDVLEQHAARINVLFIFRCLARWTVSPSPSTPRKDGQESRCLLPRVVRNRIDPCFPIKAGSWRNLTVTHMFFAMCGSSRRPRDAESKPPPPRSPFIFDNRLVLASLGRAQWHLNMKSVSAASDLTLIEPPWARTISETMYRPSHLVGSFSAKLSNAT